MSPEGLGSHLATLLTIAWLLPLLGFAIEIFGGWWSSRLSKAAGYLAVGCIGAGFVLSTWALVSWGNATDWAVFAQNGGHHAGADSHGHNGSGSGHLAQAEAPQHTESEHAGPGHSAGEGEKSHAEVPSVFSGTFYTLGRFGDLEVTIGYYIDSLTLVMFVMVTLIATCIHIFALGYMSDELTEDHVDHFAHTAEGEHVHRPGRFYRFFAYMSLFSFSMLGLVLAGNIFMVFVFWELVGICSYLLIGFYVERRSASNAANKAFIMNRVGDFGFIVGLMIIWTAFGTFQFDHHQIDGQTVPGLFQMVRGEDGRLDMADNQQAIYLHGIEGGRLTNPQTGSPVRIPYMLLVAGGLGIFAGCIGKSAQFPLQTWLPDAMEGPTPVSALVHSATMVAAGVYLTGRFYPLFTPEVLLVIAYVGCITLFLAATIAMVATDLKRVLAYSTISQLGYMMLGLGVAGWAAGLFHLVTHAFFKSLLFLCAGSVIIACHHEQEMPKMGGLWRKMPITAFTMLVGVIAISGLALFEVYGEALAFSGYHSKDAILATGLAFVQYNPEHFLLFLLPLITAGITAFYMFRLWFSTFLGQPRDKHLYEQAHETPWVMTAPLVVLALFAAFCAVGGQDGPLAILLRGSEPAGVASGTAAVGSYPVLPGLADAHAVHAQAGAYALPLAFGGMLVAFLLYATPLANPADIKRHFTTAHRFLAEKWEFDELYDVVFVQPVHVIARACAWIDRVLIDEFLHTLSRSAVAVSRWDRLFDELIVDGLVNWIGDATRAVGRSFRVIQTGQLRQYVMFIALGVLTLFALLFVSFPK